MQDLTSKNTAFHSEFGFIELLIRDHSLHYGAGSIKCRIMTKSCIARAADLKIMTSTKALLLQ